VKSIYVHEITLEYDHNHDAPSDAFVQNTCSLNSYTKVAPTVDSKSETRKPYSGPNVGNIVNVMSNISLSRAASFPICVPGPVKSRNNQADTPYDRSFVHVDQVQAQRE
jgi:hypothetical protein